MTSRALMSAIGAVVVIVLVAVAAYWSSRQTGAPTYANAGNMQPAPPIPVPANLARPEGSPAIKVDKTAAAPFGEDDVRQFIAAHPMQTSDGRPATISRIQFIPSREVSSLLDGARTGVPDDDPLCLVEFAGALHVLRPERRSANLSARLRSVRRADREFSHGGRFTELADF
jgi:hypothetical protein